MATHGHFVLVTLDLSPYGRRLKVTRPKIKIVFLTIRALKSRKCRHQYPEIHSDKPYGRHFGRLVGALNIGNKYKKRIKRTVLNIWQRRKEFLTLSANLLPRDCGNVCKTLINKKIKRTKNGNAYHHRAFPHSVCSYGFDMMR